MSKLNLDTTSVVPTTEIKPGFQETAPNARTTPMEDLPSNETTVIETIGNRVAETSPSRSSSVNTSDHIIFQRTQDPTFVTSVSKYIPDDYGLDTHSSSLPISLLILRNPNLGPEKYTGYPLAV